MRTSPDALPPGLARGLRSVYLVTGSEPLLIAEACDAIRAAARAQQYADREVHFLERGFDWNALLADAANLSLFATRRLIELRIGPTPDAEAQKSLAGLAERPPEDTVLLVSGELECKTLKTAWVKAFEEHGVLVVTQPVERPALPALDPRSTRSPWRHDRAGGRRAARRPRRGQPARRAAGSRAHRAADARARTLDAGQVAELVADSARYDVFELSAAAFSGQPERALRILAGLRGEGREPPLVLWALLNDLRGLSRVAQRLERERSLDAIFRSEQIWSNRQKPLQAALPRLSRADIDALLLEAAAVDRMAKGSLRGDAWVALELLVARIAGVRLAA